MAVSNIAAVHREVSVTLRDGTTPTAVTLTPPKRIASLTITQDPGTYVWVLSQGVRVGRKLTEDPVFTFSLAFHFTEFTNGSAGVVRDFVLATGDYSANVATTDAAYDGNSIDVIITIDKTSGDKDDTADAVHTYTDCFLTAMNVDETGDTLVLNMDFEALGYSVTGQA